MTVVNTNTKAFITQQAMVVNQRETFGVMQQLSTGKRINAASDDAAGLSIGNKLTSQILGLNAAVRNANDGISMMQTADAATNAMTTLLGRMRELAIQSINDTNSTDDRAALNVEYTGLTTDFADMISNTQWNGMGVLNGAAGNSGSVTFHIGPSSNDNMSVDFTDLNSGDIATMLATTIDTAQNAANALSSLDGAMTQLDSSRGNWGAAMNRLVHAADNAANVSLNSSASRSRIMDTDYAQATADLARNMILNQAGSAMLSQANQQPYYVLALLS